MSPRSFITDLKHTARGLARVPTLTVSATMCLAVGIGATTAIFTAVHWALLRPLPFEDPDRLVTVYRTTPQFSTGPFSGGTYLDLRAQSASFEHLVGIGTQTSLLENRGDPRRIRTHRVAGDFFEMLGVRPTAGRFLRLDDEDESAPPVTVLSYEFWQQALGADPAVLGTMLTLDGIAHEIVGVAPAGFSVPMGTQMLRSDAWTPFRLSPNQATQRRNNFIRLLGRVHPDWSVTRANDELRSIMSGIIDEYPQLQGEQLRVLSMKAESTRAVRRPLLILMGAVGFVLLIAVGNVASLLLARGVARRGEYAVRTALGAGRGALVRPALAESLLITAIGAAGGIVLAWVGLKAIVRLVPSRLPQIETLTLNGEILAVSILVALAAGTLCAIAPAWQATSTDPHDALRAGGRSGIGSRHHRWLRRLVTLEVAVSLALLLGAGLAMRGFGALVHQDPGFEPEGLVTLTVDLSPARYEGMDVADAFLAPAIEALESVPGVEHAGSINLVPYDNWGWNFNVRYEGRSVSDPTRLPLVENRYVSPDIFDVLGQRLVAGRTFEPTDRGTDTPVVVVANQALVDRDFPNEDPIGKRYHQGQTSFATIVGVVENIRNVGPYREPAPEVYTSYHQTSGFSSFPIIIRGDANIGARYEALAAAIRRVDPTAAVGPARPMTEVIATSVGSPRFYLTLLSVFAAVAMVLAIAGLYGVMTYLVARQRREIGIRSALGSSAGQTVRHVVGRATVMVGAGLVIGSLGALGLTRVIRGLLYGLSPLDPVTWVSVPLLLAVTGMAAALIPAWQASRIDPASVMRDD